MLWARSSQSNQRVKLMKTPVKQVGRNRPRAGVPTMSLSGKVDKGVKLISWVGGFEFEGCLFVERQHVFL